MAQPFIPLEAVFATTKNEPMAEARELEAKGCASSGCGSAEGADELDLKFGKRLKIILAIPKRPTIILRACT